MLRALPSAVGLRMVAKVVQLRGRTPMLRKTIASLCRCVGSLAPDSAAALPLSLSFSGASSLRLDFHGRRCCTRAVSVAPRVGFVSGIDFPRNALQYGF